MIFVVANVVFIKKITDIYAQCSADYKLDEKTTKDFFATVQNKLHWAITRQTAAELIASRADSSKENMGFNNLEKWTKRCNPENRRGCCKKLPERERIGWT